MRGGSVARCRSFFLGAGIVNIGEGKIYAVAALAGALVGARLLGSLYPALQRPFALPPLKVGTGEG